MTSSVIIVGASAAGVSAARTLRQEGFNGSITLIDSDVNGAYERPPLSKLVLQQKEMMAGDVSLLTPADALALNITTRYGEWVEAIKPDNCSALLSNGDTLQADVILLATGGSALRIPIQGNDLLGVHVLRDFSDASTLRQSLSERSTVAVIGGGLIGSETVASLNAMGHKVIWLDGAPKPLVHILPTAIADPLIDWHLTQGTELITDARIAKFVGDKSVNLIEFEDGSTIAVCAVVMGVGMKPNVSLAEASGLSLAECGIAVDNNQMTSAKGIYAAGDVAACLQSDGTYKRHEHWQAAEHQGANAARAILGLEILPEPVSWFWSDQGENHIEMAGHCGEQSVVRVEDDWPVVFEMTSGKLVGAVSVNNPNAVRVALRLLKSGKNITAEELADTSIDLRKLLRR